MTTLKLLPEEYFEHVFFDEMISIIRNSEIDHTYKIYFTNNYDTLPEYGEHVIAILTAGNERASLPKYYKNIKYVFKHHLDQEKIENVYHLPLPPMNGFNPNSKTTWKERDIDVFFSGHCLGKNGKALPNRANFVKYLSNIKIPGKNIIIKLTNKWSDGYDIKTYSDIMSRSKIILSPYGHHRSECIRFTEGVMAGCAIISCSQPKTDCYSNTPAIYLDNKKWNSAEKYIISILEDKDKWDSINKNMIQCWEKIYSAKAQANKIINTVSETR